MRERGERAGRPRRHCKWFGSAVAALAAALLCACAPYGARKDAAAPRPAAARVSPEAERRAEQLYYKAVSAYGDNDMEGAVKYLDGISAVYPGYPPAAELRAKIRRVAAPAGGGR